MTDDINELINALDDREPNTRWAAAVSLGVAGDARAVGALRAALRDNSVHVRVNVVAALGKIGVPAVDALCAALSDRSTSVAKNATKALVNIGAPAVVRLMSALGDTNELIRQLAAIALGKIADTQSVAALCLALEDENQWVRMNAADALNQFGDQDVLVRKILLNSAMSLRSRQAALNSLRQANRYPPGPRYRRQPSDAHRYCEGLKNDYDLQVRKAAGEMLRYLYGDTLVRSSEDDGRDLLTPVPGDDRPSQDDDLLRSVKAPTKTT